MDFKYEHKSKSCPDFFKKFNTYPSFINDYWVCLIDTFGSSIKFNVNEKKNSNFKELYFSVNDHEFFVFFDQIYIYKYILKNELCAYNVCYKRNCDGELREHLGGVAELSYKKFIIQNLDIFSTKIPVSINENFILLAASADDFLNIYVDKIDEMEKVD